MLTEARVATFDERLVRLEVRVSEHSDLFGDIRQRLTAFEQRVDARFNHVDARFTRVEQRLDSLNDRLSQQFRWIVGLQITVLVTVVGALTAALLVRL